MKQSKVIYELRQLVKKPPEDVTAKMQLHALAQETEKNGLPDKQAEDHLIEQLKQISRMTIDKEIFRTLETLSSIIQKDGITA